MADDNTDLPIDPIVCWLVWALSARTGEALLQAITMTRALALKYRDQLAMSDNWIRVVIEESRANHLYGGTFGR
jgi:hypothetical protein